MDKKERGWMIKKKTKKNHYFTQVTEDAIVEYVKTECSDIRTRLYAEHIQPAFDEMVDKIVYTYKFNTLNNVDYLKDDCKIWLTTILGKFDPQKGKKAFSYFSVVTKNWFTHKAKKQTTKNRREIHYDSMIREVDALSNTHHAHPWDEAEEREFWIFLMKEVEEWRNLKLKENEKRVLEAVIFLMSNIEQIEIFNKKAIYLYMREITGMNTKQIVGTLNKLRARYRIFKSKWDKGEIK